MAKNLKLNVKNTQLAEALKKLKKPEGSSSKKEDKKTSSVSKAPAEKPAAPSLPVETKPAAPPQPLEPSPKPKVEAPTPKPQAAVPAPAPLKPEQPPKRFAPGFGPGGQRPPSAMRPSRPPYHRSSPPGGGGGQHRDFRSYPPRSGSFQRPDHQGGRPPFRPHGDRPGGSSFRPGGSRPPFNQGPRPPFNQGGRPPFNRPPLRPMPPFPKQGEPLPKTDKRTDDQSRRKTTAFKDFKDVKSLRKPEAFRDFDSRDKQGLRSEDDAIWRRRRRSASHKGHLEAEEIIRPKSLKVRLPITIKDLASEMKVKASQLISTLFMKGVVLTLNDYLDDETTVQLLGHELDCEISIDTSEAERLQVTDKTIRQEISETAEDVLSLRPPVVTFMGHVDHGKTSLIDAIRKSNIAQGEAGAITQHIGAFQCHTPVGDITILDTPGHEAFSAMRSRGADVTDLVVLVIAGDEGMRAQTVEALEQARTSQVPIMVAINKSDKPNFDPENVYRQLSEQNLLPEAWGGQTITVNCSALTGQGVKELLEMLALQAEILELKANPSSRARGTVIESEMHKGLGAVATVLVQNGTLKIGDALVFDQCWGRVKTMHNEHGKEMVEAGPSSPAKITGLSGLPEAGSEFIVVENEREARDVSEGRAVERKHIALHHKKGGLENFLQRKAERQEKKILNLVLRADVQGSLEALKHSLEKIVSSKVELNIVSSEVGEISESDVQLASASKAVLVGFHTQIESRAEVLIKEMKVTVRLHDIIYHAVDDVKQLMLGLLDKIAQENDIGEVAVKAIFKSSHLGNIAGCQVADGLVRRNSHIRVIRNKEVIWKGPIASLKREKEDVKEVSKGQECGIVLQGFSDFKEGDLLQAFDITYLTQEL